MIVIGASAFDRTPFINLVSERKRTQQERQRWAEGSASDHVAVLNAVQEIRRIRNHEGLQRAKEVASDRLIRYTVVRDILQIGQQIRNSLVEADLIPPALPGDYETGPEFGPSSLNANSGNISLIRSLLLSGLYPNLAVQSNGAIYGTDAETKAIVHSSSVIAVNRRQLKWSGLLAYSELNYSTDGGTIFIRDSSVISPLTAFLFGGRLRSRTGDSNMLEMDDWLPFNIKVGNPPEAVKVLVEFRKALDRHLTASFMQLKRSDRYRRPSTYLAEGEVTRAFSDGIVEVSPIVSPFPLQPPLSSILFQSLKNFIQLCLILIAISYTDSKRVSKIFFFKKKIVAECR